MKYSYDITKTKTMYDRIDQILSENHLKHAQLRFVNLHQRFTYKISCLDLPDLKEKVLDLLAENLGDDLIVVKETKTILWLQLKEEK